MANPYTEVTVSSYNANPPSDDGSTASTNQLKWSNHKTKLGDPLKTAIESTQTNLTTAFGRVPFIDKVALTTTHNQVAGDRGKMYTVASGTFTINLLAAATASAGYTFGLTNYGSGVVTLDPDGSETINGASTIALSTGGSAVVTCDGSNWFAVGGSFTSATSTELNILDGVTSTAAELNILDGVTSTTAELNELDASANNVSGWTSGVRTALKDDVARNTFDIDGNIAQTTWETVGPTGSGATNIATALDDIPLGATHVIARILISQTAIGAWEGLTWVGGRENGSSTTGTQTGLCMLSVNASALTQHANIAQVTIPLDGSNIFELYWDAQSTSALTMNMYVDGWII